MTIQWGVERDERGRIINCWCPDCFTEDVQQLMYMVHDDLWEQVAWSKRRGVLCIKCFEIALGRQLTRYDFTSAPINIPMLEQFYAKEL